MRTITFHECGHEATGFEQHRTILLCDNYYRSGNQCPTDTFVREEVQLPGQCDRCLSTTAQPQSRKKDVATYPAAPKRPSIKLKRSFAKDSISGPQQNVADSEQQQDAPMTNAPGFAPPVWTGEFTFESPVWQNGSRAPEPGRKFGETPGATLQKPVLSPEAKEDWDDLKTDQRELWEETRRFAQEVMAEKQLLWEAGKLVKVVQSDGNIEWCTPEKWEKGEVVGDRRHP